ncbi:MAG: MerR family transcriptional regulator [Chloroflexi bacterium]|nr:MerR family transcriptional regulator [Chloroflexota bacterium]
MSDRSYLIHELAEITGVSLRTIRYYIEQGLLPEPPVKGRYAAYSEEYVDRIRLIKMLKDQRLPLNEIREETAGLSHDEVRETLKRMEDLRPAGPQRPLPGVMRESNLIREVKDFLNNPRSVGVKPLFHGHVWEHIAVAPGIELHIRRTVDARQLRKIQEIIDFAHRKLKEDG